MFTGLIEQVGSIQSIVPRGTGRLVTVAMKPWADALVVGESIAVNGTCLSVTAYGDDWFTADMLEETLRLTALAVGRVNLERAVAVGSRLGGHIVTGHVDEVGELVGKVPRGADFVYRVRCSQLFARRTVLKGSVTLDGVSLTVSGLGDDWFEVNLIPETCRATTLGALQVGAKMNLESDILGKYVARLLGQDVRGLTLEGIEKAFG